jgi:hypothetical protein
MQAPILHDGSLGDAVLLDEGTELWKDARSFLDAIALELNALDAGGEP